MSLPGSAAVIDPDAVLGVLRALAEDADRNPAVDLPAYRDRIVALAEDVGICGAMPSGNWLRAVRCDLTDGHRGMHSGLDWSALLPDELGAHPRLHWSSLSGAERRA